jgi:hypothetical protein
MDWHRRLVVSVEYGITRGCELTGWTPAPCVGIQKRGLSGQDTELDAGVRMVGTRCEPTALDAGHDLR